ncbi:MAG: alpha/beta hydrolase [Holophagales bacterium]|nr:alpha/beta hydrolase [Holophagales bacterium]MYF94370.1 alpha/beta hydrolase [Holophagales bacterium]
MKRSNPRALPAVALGLTLALAFTVPGTQPAAAQESGSWTIGERVVPAPAGASEELRAALAAAPAPNVAASRQQKPQSDEQWLMLQKATANADLDQLASGLGVSIEKDEIGDVTVYRVTPEKVHPRHAEHLFLHVHGGGYVMYGGDACVGEAATVAAGAGIPALSVDYRMPPEHPFPAAVEDVVSVYKHLLESRSAKSIAIGGASAGGGLALAAVHRFIALGLDVPGAIYAGTPWADLTKTGDSLFTNEGLDRFLVTYDGLLKGAAELYADGHDLKDPLLSPVYGDFEGFPPTYLVTGTRDMFLSDTARTHRKLRAAGAVADLHVYEGVAHGEYLALADSPESKDMLQEVGAFFNKHLE